MKRYFLLLLFLLTSCTQAPMTIPTATETWTATAEPLVTDIPATVASSPTGTPVPCDPLVADFCITDGHFVFARPIFAPDNDSVEETYRFASTAAGTRDPHHGVEFVNATGTPVHAAGDGEVVFAGPDKKAVYSPWPNFYGNLIVLRHADGLFTLYAHLSKIDVSIGQTVSAGEKIGEVGLTGSANGSHLHFEVRRGDVEDYFSSLNPELWLTPRMDEGVLAISVVNAQGKFQNADFTIQSADATYFIKTYEDASLVRNENAALGLKAGRYRIALLFNGTIYERWVEVQSGKFTQTIIVVQ
ncbi:MAG: M23 family metallopeptidase [Chloroflexota bacterium]